MKKYLLVGVVSVLTLFACHTTFASTVPTVITVGAASITTTTATIKGNLTSLGGVTSVTNYGFNLGTSTSYGTVPPGTVLIGSASSTAAVPIPFSYSATGLICGTTYHFRAYAINSVGLDDGVNMIFSTIACPVIPPTVTITSATYTGTTATLTGKLLTLGSGATGIAPASLATAIGFTSGASPIIATPSSETIAGTTFTASYTVACSTAYSFTATASNTNGSATSPTPAGFTTVACPTLPIVTTSAATPTAGPTYILHGTLISMGGTTGSTSVGFDFGTTTSYGTVYGAVATFVPSSSLPGSFNTGVITTSLTCGITYHFRAYATNSAGTAYGADMTFIIPCATTPPISPIPPTVTTGISPAAPATSITSTSAAISGTMTSAGTTSTGSAGGSTTSALFNYGTTPTALTTATPSLTPSGGYAVGSPFIYAFPSGTLACATTYYYQASIVNSAGSATDPTSPPASFTTAGCPLVVVTTAATAPAPTSMTFNGYISAPSSTSATMVGYNYNTVTTTTTTLDPSISMSGTFGAISFPMTVTGLACDTLYHFRAWATNSVGTFYGADMTATTEPCPLVPPTVSITSATYSSTTMTATLTGELITLGSDATGVPSTSLATAVGFNDGTSAVTATPASETLAGTTFTNTSYPVSCGTTYSFNATASNTNGSATSPTPAGFTTAACPPPPPPIVVPTVTTNPATATTTTAATINGTVTDLGGDTSASTNFIVSGGTMGTVTPASVTITPTSFLANLTGLSCATPYTFTAQATNSAGMGSGSTLSFTTLACPTLPVVTTNTPTLTGLASTYLQGTLVSLGINASGAIGAPATLGFKYGTVASGAYGTVVPPASITPASPVGVGNFSALITGLQCGTAYQFIAYANNDAGSGTGTSVSFTTGTCQPPTVSTVSGVLSTGASSGLYTFTGDLFAYGSGSSSALVGFRYGTTTTGPWTSVTATTPTGGTVTGSIGIAAAGSSSSSGLHPAVFTYTLSPAPGIACPGWYLEAWATNSAGITAYGRPIQFCQ